MSAKPSIYGPLPEWTEVQLGWVVGLLEGEGYFGADSRSGRSTKLDLKMTDQDVVSRFAVLVGVPAGPYITKSRAGHKTTYRLAVSGERAREVMRRILPHMGERRTARIQELLSTYPTGPQVEEWDEPCDCVECSCCSPCGALCANYAE